MDFAAEADDAEREKRRNQLHEPYRTLLGRLSCAVERWDYQSAAHRFELVHSDTLDLDRCT